MTEGIGIGLQVAKGRVAAAMTARGPLAHRVEVAEGRIAFYRIDAPTEVNFRTGGPAEAGLIGAPAANLAHAARLHILAIDPCVDFSLEIGDA